MMRDAQVAACVRERLRARRGLRVYERRQLRALCVSRLCCAQGIYETDALPIRRILWSFLPTLEDDEDLEYALQEVRAHGRFLGTALGRRYRSSREVVLEAVANTGHALADAAESLRNDPEVILKAVTSTGFALHYVPPYARSSLDPGIVHLANSLQKKG